MTVTPTWVRGKEVPDTSWTKDASCRGHDPNLWFPTGGSTWEERKQIRTALDICRQCPVKEQCLNYALRHEREGIWGGRTQREREALRRHLNMSLIRVPARAHL